MKILLGGIPLGCDNIGDEAIISCVVKIFREILGENCDLTISTKTEVATAQLLNVKCVKLIGFNDIDESVMRGFDYFVWAGATGLSDYPFSAIRLLELAEKLKIERIVWNVGMDNRLNPAFFRAGGKRLMLLKLFSKLALSLVDMVALYESFVTQKAKKALVRELNKCKLVVVRDEETVRELQKIHFEHAIAGADSAIELATAREDMLPKAFTDILGKKILGVCISAQRVVKDLNEIAYIFDKILKESEDIRIAFIPMNPVTDNLIMLEVQKLMEQKERTLLIENCENPEVVQLIASKCKVVISSRLHLLILASNNNVPIIGVSRGSKIDNFLANFDFKSVGSVSNLNIRELERQIYYFLANEEQTKILMQQRRDVLYKRLKNAKILLQKALNE